MEEIIKHHIARRVRQFRAARGMTLQALSVRTGFSKGLLSKIENCNVSPPIGTLSKLATALDVPIGDSSRPDDRIPARFSFPSQAADGARPPRSSELRVRTAHLRPQAARMQPMIVYINGRTTSSASRSIPVSSLFS